MMCTTLRTLLRRHRLGAVVVLLSVACGAPPSRTRFEVAPPSAGVDDASGGERPRSAGEGRTAVQVQTVATSESVISPESSETRAFESPNLLAPPPREPAPLTLIGYAIVPDRATRVLLGTLELPPGERFVPPVSSCQDVLVYLSAGTLDASGVGIASVEAPMTLYAGDAVRFGPEGDGLVVNTSSERVRTLVAIAREENAGPARVAPEERSDVIVCGSRSPVDPLIAPLRVASVSTSPTIAVGSTGVEVRILLDADGVGAEHAGLAILSAPASAGIAEHVHDAAAEVLYVEDGDGVMRLGARRIDVHPGVSVYVPAGMPHAYEPSGSRPLRVVQFYAPSGPEQRFRGAEP